MNFTIGSKGLLVISILVGIYVFLAFAAPVLMKSGYVGMANAIYQVYEKFCHQKVERSLFLFGEKNFYTIVELKEKEFLPNISSQDFGHDYIGNREIGYKVAFCIRDIALYISFVFAGLLVGLKKKVSISWVWIIFLLLPIFLDVGVQMVIEYLRLGGNYALYVDNIPKRIFTGVLGGVGTALLLRKIFENSLTNKEETGNI